METLGELVRAWREGSELELLEFARMVGVDYQNIQNLEDVEKKVIKRPRYLPELADAMGTTVKDLLDLKMPPFLRRDRGSAGEPDTPEESRNRFRGEDIARVFDKLPLTEQDRFLRVLFLMKDGLPSLGNLIARDAAWLSWSLGSMAEVVPDRASGSHEKSKGLK